MKLDHLGIAVADLDVALEFWRDALGLELTHVEVVESEGVRTAFLPIGDTCIELLEAIDDSSPIAKHIAKRGPGIHHICLAIDGLQSKLDSLNSAGVRLVDNKPRPGAHQMNIAFLHPKATGGVLVELAEPGDKA
ncbi:MAG: methylmalonyl-CoA epimerase [Myxococcota bacterium]|nr:methylmalonyl-CoA epimerase [Myxococcota bacterium]